MDSPPEGMSKMQLIAWKKKVARGGVLHSPPGSPQPRGVSAPGSPQQPEPQPPAAVAEPPKQTQVSAPKLELEPNGKGAEPEDTEPPPEGMSKMQLIAWKKKVARGGVPPSPPGSPQATGSLLPGRLQQKPELEPEHPAAAAREHMQKPTLAPTPNGSGSAPENSEQSNAVREGVPPSPTPGSLRQQQPPSAAPCPPGAAPGRSATPESILELETSTPEFAVVDHADGRHSHQALENGFALASHSDPAGSRESVDRNLGPKPASLSLPQRTAELEAMPAIAAGQLDRTKEEAIRAVLAKEGLNEGSISQEERVPKPEPAPAAAELAPATPPKRTEASAPKQKPVFSDSGATPEDKRKKMQAEQSDDLNKDVAPRQVPKVVAALPAALPRAGYRRGYMMAHTDTSPSSRQLFSVSPAWSHRLSPALSPQLPASRTPPAMLLAPHRTTRPKLSMQEYDMILAE